MIITDARSFGALVRTYRTQRGMTQEQLAEATGLATQSCISRFERGARSPNNDTFNRLSQALCLTRDERERLWLGLMPMADATQQEVNT